MSTSENEKSLPEDVKLEDIDFRQSYVRSFHPVLIAFARGLQEKKTFGIYIPDEKYIDSAKLAFFKALNPLKMCWFSGK
jgi:hypothetical protein